LKNKDISDDLSLLFSLSSEKGERPKIIPVNPVDPVGQKVHKAFVSMHLMRINI
jgi:hypothetical protein